VQSAGIIKSARSIIIGTANQMDREQIVQQYFHAWLNQNRTVFDRIFTEDLYYSECYGPEYHGLKEVKHWFDDWQRHGKVLQWNILHCYQDGSHLIVEWYFQCDYDQKQNDFNGISMIEFTDQNKICSIKEFQSKAEHFDPYGK